MNRLGSLVAILLALAPAPALSTGNIIIVEEDATEWPSTTDFVPVAVLAGQSEADVARDFEPPSRCEPVEQGNKCLYKAEAVEIVFIGGRADWFTVYPTDALFLPSSLSQLGLPTDERPAFSNEHVTRWTNLAGLREVQLTPGLPGKLHAIHVKARTP